MRNFWPTAHLQVPQTEFERVAADFGLPEALQEGLRNDAAEQARREDLPPAYLRWLERNVHAHRCPATAR